jgi:hypothetical protein
LGKVVENRWKPVDRCAWGFFSSSPYFFFLFNNLKKKKKRRGRAGRWTPE